MGKTTFTDTGPTASRHTPPVMPPPPYVKQHFIKPSSFKSTVNQKLDNPLVSLFQLSVRLLQLIFAFASGISYAIELAHGSVSSTSSFVFAQVVFGSTLITLIIYGLTVRYYRFSWMVEWVLTIFWIALFGVFYEAYLATGVDERYQGVNMGRMRRAVWCNLANALLWGGSAIFASAMCCSGVRGAVKAKLEERRQKKEGKRTMKSIGEMETGTVSV
ncbi:hypothetical protein P153DRAFT_93787 [Dothidotthia symphoricarpi CBS 119687]|uniref:MARVEL domain-containing protein n=1 Tax=Dothidotthia symphoricarpi CBS 119687 TaxID=1392245 RepID=A0A6A6A3M8_9PLEO|nr:uncharacterized protein P153DRAFT_93787 [Dothidotthia symphoricarpi CBS 119687]KAF2125785.1 hypothetical protein P153DRAFT_93787 [Dothidotthia symphoricarpi CBS 119687]